MSTLKKILMVDDDVDLREALADQLVLSEEFDVFEATTGADGLVNVACASCGETFCVVDLARRVVVSTAGPKADRWVQERQGTVALSRLFAPLPAQKRA